MKNFENELTTKNMTQACHNGFTRLVKPFRSDLDSSVEPKAQSDSQSSQTKYRNCVAHSYGFTLAETLITVAILGVVAAITIPAIINHQTESANRTKLKKAMTTYEKALNQMIIENDLKTNQAIKDFGEEGGLCKNTTEYFKKVEGSGCRFKTADRIWWDISDIENPIISLKDEITAENAATMKTNAESLDSDRTSFAMIGRLDDSTGTFRINDNGFEQANGSDDQKKYMTKLYNFMNKVENAAAGGGGEAEPELFSDSDFGKNCVYNSDKTKCTYTYDCPTAENATKTCTAEMTKATFKNTCVSLNGRDESCSTAGDAAVVVLSDTNAKNWSDSKKACEDAGLKMATAAQVQQLYNSDKTKSILENLCDNCSIDDWAWFWVAEETSNCPYNAYGFDTYGGGFGSSDKTYSDDSRVVCVGK